MTLFSSLLLRDKILGNEYFGISLKNGRDVYGALKFFWMNQLNEVR